MSGTKIGRSERNKQGDGLGPGPGAYESGYKAKSTAEIKIGTGQRGTFGKGDTPGPGAYELLKKDPRGITISGFKGKQEIELTPGPGTYDIRGEVQRPCSAKYFWGDWELGKVPDQI